VILLTGLLARSLAADRAFSSSAGPRASLQTPFISSAWKTSPATARTPRVQLSTPERGCGCSGKRGAPWRPSRRWFTTRVSIA